MEENFDIFLAGDDALLYLDVPVHKKCVTVYTFWVTPSITLIAYVLNRCSISKPKYR